MCYSFLWTIIYISCLHILYDLWVLCNQSSKSQTQKQPSNEIFVDHFRKSQVIGRFNFYLISFLSALKRLLTARKGREALGGFADVTGMVLPLWLISHWVFRSGDGEKNLGETSSILGLYTHRKFNIARKTGRSQKETSIPIINFQGLC